MFSFSVLEGSDIIESKFSTTLEIKNILAFLFISFIVGLYLTYKESKESKESKEDNKEPLKKVNVFSYNKIFYINILLILIICGVFFFYIKSNLSAKALLEFNQEKISKIITDYESGDIKSVYRECYNLINSENNFKENTNYEYKIIEDYFNKVSQSVDIISDSLTDIYFKFTSDTTNNWTYLGVSPIKNIKVPLTSFYLKFNKDSSEFISITHPYYLKDGDNYFFLPQKDAGNINQDFKLFLGGNKKMLFPGLDHEENIMISPYKISKYEVSNSEFKEFIDSGGYQDSSYWDFPIEVSGINYNFSNTINKFVGKFGKPGPANWTYSRFPSGHEDYPVTGISWFEARAYANYKDLALPTIYQWSNSANLGRSNIFVPKSNFSKNQFVNTFNDKSNNLRGLHNIAGNVREWVINSGSKDNSLKVILGGCFKDPDYAFNDFYSQNIFDRSIGNGLRLVENLDHDMDFKDQSNKDVYIEIRDFLKTSKISNDVFDVYLSQFLDYNKSIVDTIFNVNSSGTFQVDRYEISGISDSENILPGYIFYDSSISPPFKPIIYFPGSNAIHLPNTDMMISQQLKSFDYLMSEGYAIVFPIYTSTYEKEDDLKSDYPSRTKIYKDHVITWGKEYKKTIDYIEFNKNLDIESLSYFGESWGGYMGNILLAIDQRVKSAVLHVAGLCFQETYKEVDLCLFTPRITCPTLMLNGKYDCFFPLETSQKPMFKLLGTDEKDKKHFVFESGHYVPRANLIREHLDWLKTYN